MKDGMFCIGFSKLKIIFLKNSAYFSDIRISKKHKATSSAFVPSSSIPHSLIKIF